MAAVDLGDRSELIDLVYGPPKETSVSAANSTTSLNNKQAVVKENGRNERIERTEKVRVIKENKKSSKITCSCCTIFCLVLLAVAAILLSGFCAYWFTKQDYESRLAMASYTPLERRNMSIVEDAPPLDMDEPEKETPFPSLEELRLPDNIKPLGYNVTLKIPLTSNSTIEGNSQIKLNVLEETNKIVFNGRNLNLPAPTKFRILSERKMIRKREMENAVNTTMESSVEEAEDAEEATTEASEFIQEVKQEKPAETLVPAGPKVLTVELNDILEKVTVTLDKPLTPGVYYLQFPFESKPSKSPLGPFVTSYKNADGTEAAGFSLIGGLRKLFPSFDEKRFDAPLKLSIIHPRDTVVLSNGQDSTSEESEPGWVETIIEKPSADNTALNVFAFDKKEDEAKNGHQIRVWARPDSLNSTEFTLQQSVQIANILQDFYSTTLPTETLNIVAVPGLLTGLSVPGQIQLPETAVLYDSTVDDVIDKVRIVQALSRQINKQFIGDVVPETDSSSKWVEDAMAHFVEKNALDAFFGSADAANQQILVNSVEKSLSLDSQSSSHPLSADRETLHELTAINDVVSKEKGAAVLRMVQSIMGRDAFRQGIRNYFKKTEKGESNYDELWKSLQESVPKDLKSWDNSDFNVADFANKWVKQMGYPVVDLYPLDPQTTELTQRRFKLDRLTPELSKFRNAVYWYKWDIPLNYWVNGDVKDMKWLHEAVRMPLNISDEILINGNAEGYYRVNYDQEGWEDIAKIFNNEHGLLSAPVRARILSDVFALAAANDLPYKIAFNVTEYLPHEDSYAPIAVALEGLLDIYERLDDSEEAVNARLFILEKIENQFEALPEFSTLTSQEKEDFLRIKRDVSVITAYCRLNHGKCRKRLADLAEENLLKPCEKSNFTCQCSTVPPALRYLVYCDAVAYGDDGIFQNFLNFARNEPVATERRRLVKSLGCSRDPLAIRRLLKNSLSNDTKLAQHDIPVFLRSLSFSDVGSLVVSDFLLDNWKDLRERLSDDVYTLSTALTNGLRPSNKRQVKLLEAFAQEHPGAKTYGSFRNQLEKGRSNLEWQRKNAEELAKLFKEL